MRINCETEKSEDPRSIVLGNHDDLLKGLPLTTSRLESLIIIVDSYFSDKLLKSFKVIQVYIHGRVPDALRLEHIERMQ
jgi:hypothetical protein